MFTKGFFLVPPCSLKDDDDDEEVDFFFFFFNFFDFLLLPLVAAVVLENVVLLCSSSFRFRVFEGVVFLALPVLLVRLLSSGDISTVVFFSKETLLTCGDKMMARAKEEECEEDEEDG